MIREQNLYFFDSETHPSKGFYGVDELHVVYLTDGLSGHEKKVFRREI